MVLQRSGWKQVQNLPRGANGNNAAAAVNNFPVPDPTSQPKIPLQHELDDDEIPLELASDRIRRGIKGMRGYAISHPHRIEPCLKRLYDTFGDEIFYSVAYNDMRRPLRELLDEDEMDYDLIMYDDESWKTCDPGSYLWQIGGESKVRKAVRYGGAAWGGGGIYFRVSQHQNPAHRQRVLLKQKCLVYEYAEGVHGSRKKLRFVVLFTIRPDNLSSEDLQGWCLFTETLGMVLFQAFDDTKDNDIALFREMYLPDMGKSPYIGANRTPSIRRFSGTTKQMSGYTDPAQKILAGLFAAWRAAGPQCNRLQNSIKIHAPGKDRGSLSPIVYIDHLHLGIGLEALDYLGLRIGDTVTVTLDIVDEGQRHPNSWIVVDPRYPEANDAMRLGICVSRIIGGQERAH
jgi:hypothetical protein